MVGKLVSAGRTLPSVTLRSPNPKGGTFSPLLERQGNEIPLTLGSWLVLPPTSHLPQSEVRLCCGYCFGEFPPSPIKWDSMVQDETYAASAQLKS